MAGKYASTAFISANNSFLWTFFCSDARLMRSRRFRKLSHYDKKFCRFCKRRFCLKFHVINLYFIEKLLNFHPQTVYFGSTKKHFSDASLLVEFLSLDLHIGCFILQFFPTLENVFASKMKLTWTSTSYIPSTKNFFLLSVSAILILSNSFPAFAIWSHQVSILFSKPALEASSPFCGSFFRLLCFHCNKADWSRSFFDSLLAEARTNSVENSYVDGPTSAEASLYRSSAGSRNDSVMVPKTLGFLARRMCWKLR